MQTLQQKITLNCAGRLVSLERPVVMGIINTTPDSFYPGSRNESIHIALNTADKMIHDGALFLDIGGYSTRPGASEVSFEEEYQRVIPVIKAIHAQFPEVPLSIDTFRSEIAEAAVMAGASLVNDISAGDDDPQMVATVAKLKVPYIIMHKKGTPANMQHHPVYEDVVNEVMRYLTNRIQVMRQAGIKDLVIDPGFGFGKNMEHNYTLMKSLNDFALFGLPILVGVSRKKMIQQVIGSDALGALNGTTVLNTIALMNGTAILRVHDVKEAVECIKLVSAVKYGAV